MNARENYPDRSVSRTGAQYRDGRHVAVVVLVLLFRTALLATASDTETHIAANDRWSDGAFVAAEAGVDTAIERIETDYTASQQAVAATSTGDGLSFRSGSRTNTTAQRVVFIGATTASGFAVGAGAAYGGALIATRAYFLSFCPNPDKPL